MRETICSVCGKHFISNTSGKYCSDECRRKALSKKSSEYQKSKRSRIQICVDCGKEYPTRRGQTKYCEECRRKHYICPICGGVKENIKQHTCKKCSTTTRICPICGKAFVAKGVKKICSKECSVKYRKLYSHNNKTHNINICNKCGKEFVSWDGLGHRLCKHCYENKNICPNCGGYKKASAEHCHHCSTLSRKYICEKCGKECIGIKHTKYCDDCYPRCKLCGKKCDSIYEECCSRSCAMKLKRTREESAKKMIQNIINMNSGKYNKGNRSSVNDLWKKMFENEGFIVTTEFTLKNDKGLSGIGSYCSFDFKIGNTLIEINPTVSHNSTKPYRDGGHPKHINYHYDKTLLGTDNGYRVISVYDRDINNQFKDWLIMQLKEKEILTDVYTRSIDNEKADSFLKTDIYTRFNGNGNNGFFEGIFYKGKTIGVIGFEMSIDNDGLPYRILGDIYITQGYDIDSESMKLVFEKITKKRKIDYLISRYDASKTDINYIKEIGFYVASDETVCHCINTKTREEDGDGYERNDDTDSWKLKKGYVELYTEGIKDIIRGG